MSSVQPLALRNVVIDDVFWTSRIQTNRNATIPHEYRMCKDTGRIEQYKLDWKPGQPNPPHIFWDSDVAKWIEAASYSLATCPDPQLDALLDEVITLIASAQQPDGYLNPHYTVVEPGKRWSNLRDCHEMYCAGHFIEAGVAHFEATGKRTLLDVVCRYADCIDATFGPGKRAGYCGHEEIELALVKLHRVTGEPRYLALSEYFINERGRQPHVFAQEARARGETIVDRWVGGDFRYYQAHVPVREQTEAIGHAVRAMYLYCGMADIARLTNDASLLAACRRLWDDVVTGKMYITGGVGSSHHGETFTNSYDLPNEAAYAETCAAIGLVFFAHRMLQIDPDSRYADVMEQALYNGVLSGVGLDGRKFFYVNPLASRGDHHRKDWFGTACCPPNIARLLASLGQYIYSVADDSPGATVRGAPAIAGLGPCSAEEEKPSATPESFAGVQSDRERTSDASPHRSIGTPALYVHLYIAGRATIQLAGQTVTLTQQGNYPWHGRIRFHIDVQQPTEFALMLRIPGWCRRHTVKVNGKSTARKIDKGYLRLDRRWQAGDGVELSLQMPIDRMAAHPYAEQDAGKVALRRGPVIYCLEQCDHQADVRATRLPDRAELKASFDKNLLGGVMVIEGTAQEVPPSEWQGRLYQPINQQEARKVLIRAIPYCLWDNRQGGAMAVWLPRS